MALTPKTGEFHKLRKELDQIVSESGSLSTNELVSFLQKRDVDPAEFKQAWSDYKETGYELDRPGLLMGRLAGRAVGETVEGLGRLFLPKSKEKAVEKYLDKKLPDSMKRTMAELFDPYHGEGLIEPIAGELASLMIPYTGAMKAWKLIRGVPKLKKTFPLYEPKKIKAKDRTAPALFGSVQEQVLKPHLFGKGKGTWAKRQRMKRRGKGLVREGIGMGGAMTVVYGPDEDIVTHMIEQYPETFKIFEGLAINPDDSELTQQLHTFRNNMIMEFPFALAGVGAIAGVPALIQAARRMKLGKTIVRQTGLSNLAKWSRERMTSKYGVDDTVLAMGLRRLFAPNRSVSEADGIAQDLMRSIKIGSREAGMKPSDIEETVNEALGGDKKAIALLSNIVDKKGNNSFTNTVGLIGRMRTMLDDLSKSITDANGNPLVTGQLAVTIDANRGVYLNRAYRLFDDPSFEEWDKLPFEIKDNAMNYFREQGLNDYDAEWVLKEILAKGSKKDFEQGIKFLGDTFRTGNLPFLKKGKIPWELKDLMGEIKDPYKNFARTYEKLSVAKAEADFMHDVSKHLVDHDLAMKGIDYGKKGFPRYRLPDLDKQAKYHRANNTTSEEAMVNLQEISNDRLQKILGRKAVFDQDRTAVNPLENLFVNESYAKFLREGIEVLGPTNAWWKKFLMLKVGTQTAKTVLSPATHGRNIMGNMVLMVANGYRPVAFGGEKNPFSTVWKRLKGRSDEEFGKYIGRLQELGIIDSSVKAGTVKQMASEAFTFEPGTAMAKLGRSPVGKGVKKTFETYQAEDDMFKILHFQKTMDDMRKWDLGLDENALEEMAAARTRDLMPNYALVPKVVKWLRRTPASDFAAWPAEVTRVSKNLLKYTYDDITGKTVARLKRKGFDISDKGADSIRDQGYRRMGGLVAASMAGDVAQNYTMNMFNLGQEDVYNINRLSSPWSQDTAKVFLSGLNKDKNGHFGVDFVNLGPIDPFSYLKAPARMLVAHLKSGKNLERPDIEAIGLATYDNIVGPFLGSSMAWDALMNITGEAGTREGQEDIAKNFGGYALRAGLEVAKALEPGVVTLARKQIAYNRAKGEGREAGFEGARSQFGYTMPEREFSIKSSGAFLRWAGVRPQRLDISAGMRRNLVPVIKNIENASAQFTRDISDPRGLDPDNLFNAYRKAVLQQLKDFQELNSLTEVYDSLLKDAHLSEESKNEVIREGVSKNYGFKIPDNLFKYMDRTRRNKFYPFSPSGAAHDLSRKYTGKALPMREIRRYQRAISGKKITDK